jgi:hypothetical protein
MTPLDVFSPDYLTARRRFRDAAGRHGWAVEYHPIAARGPGGEELTIDVAAPPESDHVNTLVLSSGVHGVEGPFGSAVQLGLLERWGRTPPVRCVLIHAVNPFGFAHRRRVNEDNVDLNRNFLPAGQPFSGTPDGYARLDPVLNPPHPPAAVDLFPLRAAWEVVRVGLPSLKQAIAAGQYDRPQGIFFGGHGPAESARILTAHYARWLGRARRVVHLDFHTGLGAWGTYKLLLERPTTDDENRRLAAWFGPGTFEACHPNGVAYDTRGGYGTGCDAQAAGHDHLFACAEFGTYGPITVLTGVKRENQAHQWGEPGSAATERAKQRLAELFCPASGEWRERVVLQGWELAERAAAGLKGV